MSARVGGAADVNGKAYVRDIRQCSDIRVQVNHLADPEAAELYIILHRDRDSAASASCVNGGWGGSDTIERPASGRRLGDVVVTGDEVTEVLRRVSNDTICKVKGEEVSARVGGAADVNGKAYVRDIRQCSDIRVQVNHLADPEAAGHVGVGNGSGGTGFSRVDGYWTEWERLIPLGAGIGFTNVVVTGNEVWKRYRGWAL